MINYLMDKHNKFGIMIFLINNIILSYIHIYIHIYTFSLFIYIILYLKNFCVNNIFSLCYILSLFSILINSIKYKFYYSDRFYTNAATYQIKLKNLYFLTILIHNLNKYTSFSTDGLFY